MSGAEYLLTIVGPTGNEHRWNASPETLRWAVGRWLGAGDKRADLVVYRLLYVGDYVTQRGATMTLVKVAA